MTTPATPTNEQTPPLASGPDATAEFYTALQDPRRWVIKQGVPIFKAHERTDPNSGKLIRVDLSKLHRIAQNMQRLERQGGVPIRMTLGHTEPGKPETQQPPVGGYYRNPRVQPFGPQGEPAVVVDEWLDPQYMGVRKNYPYRSAEYYDDTEQITGVALLTRDPYLDLGVVAYAKTDTPVTGGLGATHYSRMTNDPAYYFLTGENPVWPQQPNQPTPYNMPSPAVPLVAAPPPAAGQPVFPQPTPAVPQFVQAPMPGVQQPAPQQVMPAQYADPNQPVPYTGTWPGPAHQRANIGHSHPSGGAVYNYGAPTGYSPPMVNPAGPMPGMPAGRPPMGRPGMRRPMGRPGMPPPAARPYGRQSNQPPGRYATEPPLGGDEPGMSGGPGGDPMEELYNCLTQAVDVLSEMMGGGPGGGTPSTPPQTPFPDEQLSRSRAGGRSVPRGRYNYQRQTQQTQQPQQTQYATPQQPGQPTRTISGLPVGYQLKLDQLQYQNQEMARTVQMLMYERDQADTEWCVSEIRRLVASGYGVGDYELQELKNKPREQREAYLQHIITKYSRVPTDMPPVMLGDPTPGPAEAVNRPLTEAEMNQALQMAAGNPDPNAYPNAINYIRQSRMTRNQSPVSPMTAYTQTNAWGAGQPAPTVPPSFQLNPYGASANGAGH